MTSSRPGTGKTGSSPLAHLGIAEKDEPESKSPARRVHLYLGPMTDSLLRQSNAPQSSRIEDICRRYDLLVRAAVPQGYSGKEWIVLLQALRNGGDGAEEMIWQRLMAWAFLHGDRVQETMGIDATAISRRVRDGGAAMSAAILEMVERYWAFADEFSHEQRMEMLGLAGDDSQGQLPL